MARQIGKMLNTREPKIISGPGEVSYIVANWYSHQLVLQLEEVLI